MEPKDFRSGNFPSHKRLTRREFIKLGVGLTLSGAIAGVSACAPKATPTAPPPPTPTPAAKPPAATPTPKWKSPFPITDKPATLTCDMFLGGYGDEFWKLVAARLREHYPNLTVEFNADPRIWEVLQPKFATGNVPSFAYPGWQADVWRLVVEGQVLPLDELAEAPAYGQEDKKFKDTWVPRIRKGYTSYKGKWYLLPLSEISFVFWYNRALFEKHGWKPPTMWDEFLDLCKEIKAAGIAPLTLNGLTSTYLESGIFQQLCYKLGGQEFVRDADNLVPGVWKRPEVAEAIRMIQELFDKGYFQEGCWGMDHVSSQMEWLRGNAAIISVGSWLENEMRDHIPEGFVFDAFPVPGVKGGKGDPSAILNWAAEYQLIPAKSKHPYEAMEYYRIFFSLEFAKKFAEVAHDAMPIIGGHEGVKFSSGLEAVLRLRREAKETFDFYLVFWYPAISLESPKVLAQAVKREITIEEFGNRMEALVAQVRDDPAAPKFERPE